MEHYGSVFAAFLHSIEQLLHNQHSVTPAALEKTFPELPAAVIKKWLTELEQAHLIEREGRKLSYKLPMPDLFQ